MLEVLWRSDTQDDTKYKVLFPVTTPLMPRTPFSVECKGSSYWDVMGIGRLEVCNFGTLLCPDTVPEDRLFVVHVGTFLHDVELKNITFSTGVLTVEECNARGFTVQEHTFSNGTKSFTLQVPFDDDVVLKHVWHNYIWAENNLKQSIWKFHS